MEKNNKIWRSGCVHKETLVCLVGHISNCIHWQVGFANQVLKTLARYLMSINFNPSPWNKKKIGKMSDSQYETIQDWKAGRQVVKLSQTLKADGLILSASLSFTESFFAFRPVASRPKKQSSNAKKITQRFSDQKTRQRSFRSPHEKKVKNKAKKKNKQIIRHCPL